MLNSALLAYQQVEDYFFASISREHLDLDPVAHAYLTGLPAHSLNVLIVRQPSENLRSILLAGMRFFDLANVPFDIMLPAKGFEETREQLRILGFSPASTSTAMRLDLPPSIAPHTLPPGHPIRCTNGCLSDWSRPLQSAFESTPETILGYRNQHQQALTAGSRLEHFTLYREDDPVSSLTLTICGLVARIDDVATEVQHQRHGYATSLLFAALVHAQSHGVSHCFLEASAGGASLYRRLGFSTLFEYCAFNRAID